MSGIYIHGMEMPDYGYVCLKVFASGEVIMTKEHRGTLIITGIREKVGTAIPVPEHGDLKDVSPFDILSWKGIPDGYENTFSDGVHWLAEKLDAAPVVIPADKEGEG